MTAEPLKIKFTTRTRKRKPAQPAAAPEPAPMPREPHTQEVWTKTRAAMALLYGGLEPGDKYYSEVAPEWWMDKVTA